MDNLVDLRMRGATSIDVSSLPGTIHPFMGSNKSLAQIFLHELANVLSHKQAKKIVTYAIFNLCVIILLLLWCNGTDSMTLTAYTYLPIFDICRLLTCLVSLWVQQQKPTPIFSFGYERFEVLAVFASTILAQLGALFILKESIERMIMQPVIHTGRLLVGTAVAFVFHLAVTYSMDNKAFNHIASASSSSWLQEHVADMSESLCHIVPGLSKLLLPRINPFALIAAAGGIANIVTYILIDVNNYYSADTWAAVWIAVMTMGTMFPMSVYSGKILLQTTPSHMTGQLDKVIREASTLDGVLEFRHEHFWTLSFGKMGGSVHVRVRRDADEQLVLAHVVNRLSNLISVLTVQIFKDDWTRTSAYQIIGDTSLLHHPPLPGPPPPPAGPGALPGSRVPGHLPHGLPAGTQGSPAPGGYSPGMAPAGALPAPVPVPLPAAIPSPLAALQQHHFRVPLSPPGAPAFPPGARGTLPGPRPGAFSPANHGGRGGNSGFPPPAGSMLYAQTPTRLSAAPAVSNFISDTLGGATSSSKARSLDMKQSAKQH